MNDKIKKTWTLVVGVLCVFVAQATITFTDLTDNYELSASAAQATTQFRANSGLTLKLADAVTDGTFEIRSSFYIPDGVMLTVNVPEGVTGVKIRMKGGLRGTGTIAFGAGITELVIGAVADKSNILGGANSMPAIEAGIEFAEATGRVELTDGVSLVHWPTCGYTIAEGTIIAAMGSDLFDSDTLTLDQGWNLMVNATDAIKPGCKIVVPSGRTLYHRTTCLFSVDATSSGNTCLQSWYGGTGGDVNTISIEIQDGGRFEAQSKTDDNKIVGEITGSGVIAIANPGSLIFDGFIGFSGTIILTGLKADDYCTFRTAAGSSLADATINFGGIASSLRLEPTAGSTLQIGTVTATSAPTIDVLSAATVEFSTLNGSPVFVGHGKGTKVVVPSTYAVSAIPQGLTLSATVTDGQTVTLAGDGSADPFFGLENRGETPVSVRLAATNIGTDGELALGGKLSVWGSVPPVATVTILADAEVKASFPSTVKIVNEGGLLEFVESWKAKAALWTDASLAASFTSAKAAMSDRYDPTHPCLACLKDGQVAEWRDCRADHQEYRIRTTVFDGSSAPAPTSTSAKSFPYLQDQDGKPSAYFSKNGNRARMYIATGIGANTTLPVKCAVFAFNGALGGGNALFWEADNAFKRVETVGDNKYPTKDAPLVYSNDRNLAFRQDGAAVEDCTHTGLKAGWQILSFTCENGISIGALGPGKSENTGSDNGGQIFGEVIFFTEMPTENEILAMEKYLADKWDVTIAHTGGERPTCSVSGTGTVKLTEDASFDTTGYFAGTVDLNGKRMEIGEIKVPFKASEIPSENRILWVDPRLEGAVQFGGEAEKPDEVALVYTRDNAGLLKSAGAYYLVCPFSQDEDRRVRYTGGWFDFSNGYAASGGARGNMMFMRNEWPCKPMETYTESAETLSNVAAGFFALDSSRNGGGSLMTSSANGKTGLLRARGTNADSPIWSLESSSSVTIDTRLNGKSVKMADPFSGGRDVMSFNVDDGASLPVKVFGYGSPGSTSYANKEILGEWLLYSANVPAADRERIEAYLAWKWQERFMDGYGETRDMSVSGAGTIAVANPESLPALAQGFTGVVELTKDTYAFTLPKEGPEAVEAVKLPGQTVRMQGEVTIDLDATAAKSGSYLLMSAADFAAGTTFTLGTVTDRRTREVVLSVRDNALYADVKPNGILLIVR